MFSNRISRISTFMFSCNKNVYSTDSVSYQTFNKMQTWPTKVGHFIWTEEQSLNCNVEYRNALVYILKANNHCNLWFVYNAYLHLISIIIIVTDVYAYICVYVCSFNIKSGNTQSGSYVGGHSITEHITSINHLNK